jgi:hygromycin-B 7''-O-kinase
VRALSVETLEEYRAIYHREDLWRPLVEEVCRRHGLPCEACLRGPDGTHIVYFVGEEAVVKLFVPFFQSDFVAERLVAQVLDGRLDVATPSVIGEGEIGGWDYLILTRVRGRPAEAVWGDLPAEVRRGLMREVGRFVESLRSVSVRGLEVLAPDWDDFVRARVVAREQELSEEREELARELPSYIDSSPLSRSGGFRPALVLSDVTREHVMVAPTGDSWRVVGYVDFGDAMIGPQEYEIVAPGVEMARGDSGLLRELLTGAGYSDGQMDEGLQRRLMTCTFMHRYLRFADVVSLIPDACGATSLDELASVVWPM